MVGLSYAMYGGLRTVEHCALCWYEFSDKEKEEGEEKLTQTSIDDLAGYNVRNRGTTTIAMESTLLLNGQPRCEESAKETN